MKNTVNKQDYEFICSTKLSHPKRVKFMSIGSLGVKNVFTMRSLILGIILFPFFISLSYAQTQKVEDDFERNGTITSWFGDNCNIDIRFPNPFKQSINTSETVLKYEDVGGQYANVRFDIGSNFDLSSDYVFSLKIYVPSSGLTGNQTNQVSLKLQNGTLSSPWSTQTEIIKSIALNKWQTLTFDFLNDTYVNLDPNSPPPTQRTDFNRVVIQVNGENNFDHVLAYIDDVSYNGEIAADLDNVSNYNVLVWSDEFDEDGAINSEKWYHQTQLPSGGSWYNNEIQHYTNRQDNSFVSDGILYIVGKKETYTDQGQTKQYTSARLNSKYAFKYGKIEVRAKLPEGVGTWPAIWTLGKNVNEDGAYWDNQGFGTTSWPACGEIDIMEHWGNNQNFVQSAIHTPSSYGGTINKGGQTIATASTDFHTYALVWSPEKLMFSVDGITHYTYNPAIKNSNTWPFDAEQYLLLNFAILPDIASNFSQDALEIDYVRVYKSETVSAKSMANMQLYDLKNIPNPANKRTIISYNLPERTVLEINVYDIFGRQIKTLINEKQSAGKHQFEWNISDLPAGIYFYTLKTETKVITKKCVVDK